MLRSAQSAIRAYAPQHLLLFVWGRVPYLRGFSELVWKGGFPIRSGAFFFFFFSAVSGLVGVNSTSEIHVFCMFA